MVRDLEVIIVFLLVEDNEEEVETRHDRRRDVDVEAERLRAVVAASYGVRRGQDRGASIEGGVDASLGNRDGLLLHGLVNGHLVLHVHLIELVDTADTVVGEHERTSFDAELARLEVLAYRGGQTRRI
eukprot:CAMPEP_0170463488 /NCGR_PEP_ID=MMETSP0123-20130129/8581_1 /TAXON_ID=182087 /ORGANISM="Favella ehrenbergii, Strain Fehren 1" /LENGTH=127 /DNA_ID=CAMNT_0010728933 /DNA_START=891 /DNA_END=1274 /DNA_ORIENTATION=+